MKKSALFDKLHQPKVSYLDYFRTLRFARDLQDTKLTSGGSLCMFGDHTCVPTFSSHRSAESVIMSMERRSGNGRKNQHSNCGRVYE